MVFAKEFSVDQVITTKDGTTVTNKMFVQDGKVRTEMSARGMQFVAIVRPDLSKVYQVMIAQKMIMEMPYDAAKYKQEMAAATGAEGKYDLIGPDVVEGTSCTKYKVTSQDGKTSFIWIDPDKKAPVKMAGEDGSYSILFKNYQMGPQAPSLFEPPAGYQTMSMPSMPGGATGGGGQ